MRRIDRIIVHHSAGSETTTAAEIDAMHRARGWRGIGYHWLVRRHERGPWTLEAGRPEELEGAHDSGENATSIGICLAGEYTRQPADPDGWTVLVATVASRCRAHGLAWHQVVGHGEVPARESVCPGFSMQRLREDVMLQLERP